MVPRMNDLQFGALVLELIRQSDFFKSRHYDYKK